MGPFGQRRGHRGREVVVSLRMHACLSGVHMLACMCMTLAGAAL